MPDYDVVVIGAGNGGLTAALSLARSGRKVLLLERHNVPGGCATSFVRGRFEFEVALHQLSGVGRPERPGPLRTLLNDLGVMDRLEFVEIENLYRIVIPGVFDATLPADRPELVKALQGWFPDERDAINRFFGATAVHLIGCRLDLDKRAKGVRGAAIANPHGLVQDFLNRSDRHLWAILSNGLRLRILRDEFRNRRPGMVDEVMVIGCALHNYRWNGRQAAAA